MRPDSVINQWLVRGGIGPFASGIDERNENIRAPRSEEVRPDHLEELYESLALQPGMTPERVLKAKERVEKWMSEMKKGREAQKRIKEPRKK